ncbi:MAG: hypothetical protein LBV76_03320, partial [Deltaproteobacteria bacterium]|nr:hypothetical protein [Deltaproteobacteria bacterium]
MVAILTALLSSTGDGIATNHDKADSLFDPLIIKTMTMKNRFFHAAIHSRVNDGVYSTSLIRQYREIAEGGAG